MKKYLPRYLVTTFVILTLIILAPYFSGMLIERYYGQFTSQLSNELKFKVTVKDFKRNFFTSTALVELHVSPDDNKIAPYIIPIEQNIIHGPFVIDLPYKKNPFSIGLAHIHNKLGEQFKTQLTEFFHNDEPFVVMTKLGFLGDSTTYFSGIPTQQTTKANLEVIWDGIEGKIYHSLDLHTLNGEITAPKLSLQSEEFHLEIININSKFKTTENASLAIGNSNLSIEKLAYQEKEQPLLKLSTVDINSTLDNESADPKKLIYSLTAKIANSQILKQAFTENVYQLTAQSITPDFFTVLHATYDKKFALLDDLLRQLLSSQATVNITIPKHFSQALITFGNLQLYKNSIIGKIDPRSKEQILGEISNNISTKFDKLVANKVLVDTEDGQQYKLAVQFNKAGNILLNGEQLQNPLQALKGLEQPPAAALPEQVVPQPSSSPTSTNQEQKNQDTTTVTIPDNPENNEVD